MISLFIDTSISYPTIAIVKDNDLLFLYHDKIEKDMSSKILPIINKGLVNNNLNINSINKIFVVTGPGSFTGVRIGVTIAKIIAWTLKKDVIPISSLEYMASTNSNKKYLVSIIDARRNNVFAGIYDDKLECVKEESLINIDRLLSNINVSDSELISYDKISNSVMPQPDVIKIINRHINDKGVNPHELKPNYLKLTEAEENRLKND